MSTHRRAPTDYEADRVLLRLIRCVNGQVQVRTDCNPVFDYGRHPAQWQYASEGYHEAVAGAAGGGVVGAIDLYTRAHERVDDRLWVIVQTQVQPRTG